MKKNLLLCVFFLLTLLGQAQIIETDGTGTVLTTKGRAVEVTFSKVNVTVSPDNRSLIVSPEILERCFIRIAGVAPLVIKESSGSNWIFSEDFTNDRGETEKQVCIKYSLPKNYPNVAREAMMFLTSDEAIHVIQMPAVELAKLSVPRALKKPVVANVITSTTAETLKTTTSTSTSTNSETQTTLTITETPGSITEIATSGEIQLPGSTVTDSTTKVTQTLGPGSINNYLFGFRNTKGTIKVVSNKLFSGDMSKYSVMASINSRRFPREYVMYSPFVDQLTHPYTDEERAVLDYYWGDTHKVYVFASPGKVSDANRDLVSKRALDPFVAAYLDVGKGERDSKLPEAFKAPNIWSAYSLCYDVYMQRFSDKYSKGLSLFEKYFLSHSPVKSTVEFMGDKNATRYRLDINFFDDDLRLYCFFVTPVTFRHDVYSFYNAETNTTCWAVFTCLGYNIEALKKIKMENGGVMKSMYEVYSDYAKEEVQPKLKGFTLDAYALDCKTKEFEENLVFKKHNIKGGSYVRATCAAYSKIKDATIRLQIENEDKLSTTVEPIITSIEVQGERIPWSGVITIVTPPTFDVASNTTTTKTTTTKTTSTSEVVRTTTLDTTLQVSFKRVDIAQQVAAVQPKTKEVQFASLAAGRVMELVYDAKNLYLASDLDGKYCLVVIDKATGTFKAFDFGSIKKILIDKKNRLFIQSNDGVRVWDGVSKESSKLLISSSSEIRKDIFPNPLYILPSGNILAKWDTFELKPYEIIDPATGAIKRSVELSVFDVFNRKQMVDKVVATTSGMLLGGNGKLQMLIEGVDGAGEAKMTPLKDVGYDEFMGGYGSEASQIVANRFKPQLLFATPNGLVCWDETSRKFGYLARGNQFQKVDCASSDKVWVQFQSPFTPKGGYGFTPVLAYYDFSISSTPITTVEHPALYGFDATYGRIHADTNGNLYTFNERNKDGLLVINPNGIVGFDAIKGR